MNVTTHGAADTPAPDHADATHYNASAQPASLSALERAQARAAAQQYDRQQRYRANQQQANTAQNKSGTPSDHAPEPEHASDATQTTNRTDALPDSSAWTHGKRSTYTAKGCRCTDCREANRVYHVELRARHRATPQN